jgi:hypothetical protein
MFDVNEIERRVLQDDHCSGNEPQVLEGDGVGDGDTYNPSHGVEVNEVVASLQELLSDKGTTVDISEGSDDDDDDTAIQYLTDDDDMPSDVDMAGDDYDDC